VPVSTYPAGAVPAHGTNNGVLLALTAGPHQIQITAAIPPTTFWPNNASTPIPFTGPLTFRLTWSRLGETLDAAMAVARAAKVAVVFADDNGRGAFSPLPGVIDTSLVASLAPNEDALIAAVVKANPNTIVVLNTGDPVLMPWLSSVKGVLEMWYPGQEGGTSTAKLLLGQVNPAGKLPISWPGSGDQTLFDGHPERITGDGRWCSPKASIWATVGTTSKTLRHCFPSATACLTRSLPTRAWRSGRTKPAGTTSSPALLPRSRPMSRRAFLATPLRMPTVYLRLDKVP